jgi:hypothetical protein
MDAEQREYLQKHFQANDWSRGTRGVIKDFMLDGSEIRNWSLSRSRRDELAKPPVIHSIWSHGKTMSELLAIDLFECSSAKGVHTQLLDVLGNMESAKVARQYKPAIGDIAFGLNDTMMLFARANMVVLLRNAGPTVVSVGGVAHELDRLLTQRLKIAPGRQPRRR